MFKSKKADFPPRPDPPTWEQMKEDLEKADKTDVIFTHVLKTKDVKEEDRSGQRRRSSAGSDGFSENAEDDQLFQQAVDFVEKNDDLLDKMKLLSEETKKLQDVSTNLRQTVQEVKKQALVAIDGY